MRIRPGSSVNSVLNCAKSTCACSPGAISKRCSKPRSRSRTDLSQVRRQLRVTARVAQLANLPEQACSAHPGVLLDAFAQVPAIRVQQLRPRRPRTVARRLQPLLEVLAHGLAIQARVPCDRRDPITPGDAAHESRITLHCRSKSRPSLLKATMLRASSGFGNDVAEPLNWGFFTFSRWGVLLRQVTVATAVDFDQYSVVNVVYERASYGFQMRSVTVARELYAAGEPLAQIVHELDHRNARPFLRRAMRARGFESGSNDVHIHTSRRVLRTGYVLVLPVDERRVSA